MAIRSFAGPGEVEAVAGRLSEEIQGSAMSCELVDSVRRGTAGGDTLYVMVFEKYYMRAGNRASLTVSVCAGPDGHIHVDAIGAGGGQGPIFKFSWGAEEDFTDSVAAVLQPLGFWDEEGTDP
ncbi:MAG: DUF6054 family protein [Oscillospiraceae bacterium]|nr:DUF6054 family protein [Oscillospiraceae bacterium]